MARILARSSSWDSGTSTSASVSDHSCHAPRYSQTSGGAASYCSRAAMTAARHIRWVPCGSDISPATNTRSGRSEEHTSELQSHLNLVCRLLLEKKKKTTTQLITIRTTHGHNR